MSSFLREFEQKRGRIRVIVFLEIYRFLGERLVFMCFVGGFVV